MSRTNIHVENQGRKAFYIACFEGTIEDQDFPDGHVEYAPPFPGQRLGPGESGIVASIGDPGASSVTNTGSFGIYRTATRNEIVIAKKVEKVNISKTKKFSHGGGHDAEADLPGLSDDAYAIRHDGADKTTDAKSVTIVIYDLPE
ncbi:hypothetical protein KAJ83_02605 [Marivibrio halodurans]|uniref:Uncharacterized protein n=1 Tax=Marivibrio halodurans TaxID=2039722 RepID=A0A8J7RZF6_9PROT|nr:hypothetical protein [Marivibrio halodurans]MBP5855883.1 hypothetical protein [Marivibrio halodurans]